MSAHPTSKLERIRFGPLVVEFDDRVLRPRDWTLLQVEWAVELARTAPRGPILELCAGAGHIGLAAAVLSGRDLVQVERDPVAAGFALRNAARAGHGGRTDVRVGPMRDALTGAEQFPLIVADPPYLPSAQIGAWPDDPVDAIDGGSDGLALVRECLHIAAQQLLPDGQLLLQLAGPRQAARAVAELPPGLIAGEVRAVDEHRAVLHVAR